MRWWLVNHINHDGCDLFAIFPQFRLLSSLDNNGIRCHFLCIQAMWHDAKLLWCTINHNFPFYRFEVLDYIRKFAIQVSHSNVECFHLISIELFPNFSVWWKKYCLMVGRMFLFVTLSCYAIWIRIPVSLSYELQHLIYDFQHKSLVDFVPPIITITKKDFKGYLKIVPLLF